MRRRYAAIHLGLVLVLVGCELGNPAVVVGPDAGDRSLDVAQSVDVAADVGGDQGVGDDAIDAAVEETLPMRPPAATSHWISRTTWDRRTREPRTLG